MDSTRINEKNKDRALLDFTTFADHTAVCEYIDIMSERYSFMGVTSIGESILGKRIHLITLGNEKADKSVLYVGVHHGA